MYLIAYYISHNIPLNKLMHNFSITLLLQPFFNFTIISNFLFSVQPLSVLIYKPDTAQRKLPFYASYRHSTNELFLEEREHNKRRPCDDNNHRHSHRFAGHLICRQELCIIRVVTQKLQILQNFLQIILQASQVTFFYVNQRGKPLSVRLSQLPAL